MVIGLKKIITIIICLSLIGVSIYKHDVIIEHVLKYFNSTPKIKILDKSEYYKDYDFNHIKNSKDFIPYNYQDLLNIFFTIFNSRYDKFTFYCPIEYLDCISDIEYISKPENIDILTNVGNFVSPYNNFSAIKILYDTAGEVTVETTFLYTNAEIEKINNKISEIANTLIKDDMQTEDIIYAWHDYIINTTKYDENYEKELKEFGSTTYHSNKAIGPLFEGVGICSGYTDTMAIILDQLKINNYKVASDTHVWNAVYLKNSWKHLDLTWDDPVSDDHKNNLLHKFYLIDTPTLEKFDIKDHKFDKTVYSELKEKESN